MKPSAARLSRFTYDVVTSNGAGVHSSDHKTCASAKKAAARLATLDRTHHVKFAPFEIQRVEHVSPFSRRYQVRRRHRWVQWNPHEDIDARQPDWRFDA